MLQQAPQPVCCSSLAPEKPNRPLLALTSWHAPWIAAALLMLHPASTRSCFETVVVTPTLSAVDNSSTICQQSRVNCQPDTGSSTAACLRAQLALSSLLDYQARALDARQRSQRQLCIPRDQETPIAAVLSDTRPLAIKQGSTNAFSRSEFALNYTRACRQADLQRCGKVGLQAVLLLSLPTDLCQLGAMQQQHSVHHVTYATQQQYRFKQACSSC